MKGKTVLHLPSSSLAFIGSYSWLFIPPSLPVVLVAKYKLIAHRTGQMWKGMQLVHITSLVLSALYMCTQAMHEHTYGQGVYMWCHDTLKMHLFCISKHSKPCILTELTEWTATSLHWNGTNLSIACTPTFCFSVEGLCAPKLTQLARTQLQNLSNFRPFSWKLWWVV